MQDIPRARPGHPLKIALGHIARFRQYDRHGAALHMIFSHNLSWGRIAGLTNEARGEMHESLHWQLGTEAHR